MGANLHQGITKLTLSSIAIRKKKTLSIQTNEGPREDMHHLTPMEDLVEIEIYAPPNVVKIGVELPKEQVEALTEMLIKFKELLAWSPSEITGNATFIITHELNINPLVKPIT